VISTVVVAVQPPVLPLASLTTTVYVPALRLLMSSNDDYVPTLPDFVHVYVYGAVPPLAVMVIAPVAPP